LELACGDAGAGIEFAALLQPGLCKADHHPAKQAQGKGRFGMANATVILGEGYVQRVVQAAFDGPVASFKFEQVGRVQLYQGETADEINDFSGLFALASDSPPQPGDGLNPGKAHLLGGGVPAIQHSDFASAPIVLPRHRVGVRRGLRGKNAVG